jgi:hypothetical protein
MESLKSHIACVIAVTTVLLTASLVTQQSARADDKKGLRAFYITKDFHDGSQALTACAAGFHMASLWEILDPSNLRYDSTSGFTWDDSGSGPPISATGWIRTGNGASTSSAAGQGNCNAWTSSAPLDRGTEVFLANLWESTVPSPIHPWVGTVRTCSEVERVWCVED